MFCVKFSIYRLEVVSKCYRGSSFMECDKFIFKKTGNPRLQVGGKSHCCERLFMYWVLFNKQTAV